MAKGGKRAGAGRPKGSVTRPQIRDHFSEKDIEAIVEMLKTHMVDDMQLLKFVAEQIFGKAPQSLDLTTGGEKLPTPILSHVSSHDGPKKDTRAK